MAAYKREGWQFADICPPEEDGVYIVTDKTGAVYPAEYREKGFGAIPGRLGALLPEDWYKWRDIYTDMMLSPGEVLAWMELPAPFRG